MFWVGLCVIAAALAGAIWRITADRNCVITDALIVDHTEVVFDGAVSYKPIVQIIDLNGQRYKIQLFLGRQNRQGGTIVVRYPVGRPALARVYFSPFESLLICAGVGLAGVLMVAFSHS